jgi:hypothetical protein
MLFVFLSHFGGAYFPTQDHRGWALADLGMVASPTFMLISGMLIALLYRTQSREFASLRLKLVDRGLFLLVIAHPLILIGCWPEMHTARMIFITDVVAVNMVLVPWLVTRTSDMQRLWLGGALLTCSWCVAALFHPVGAADVIVETLFGALKPDVYATAFPLLPWLGVAVIGTAVGGHIAKTVAVGDHPGTRRRLLVLGALGVALAVASKAAFYLVLGPALSGSPWQTVVRALMSPTQKLLPSPAYLGFYGGCGLSIVALGSAADASAGWSRLVALMATLGQNALFMFVLQFYVYESGVYEVARVFGTSVLWPVVFAATVVVIAFCTLQWHRLGYRRFLTVGVPQLIEWWKGRTAVKPSLAISRV